VAQVAQADVYAMSDNEESGLRDEERDEVFIQKET
jgi:hypothetical protein